LREFDLVVGLVVEREAIWSALDNLGFFLRMCSILQGAIYMSRCFVGSGIFPSKGIFTNDKAIVEYVFGFADMLHSAENSTPVLAVVN